MMDQNSFLLFQNGLLAFVSMSALLFFGRYLFLQLEKVKWPGIRDYLLGGVLRNRGTATEIGLALVTIFLGLCARTGMIWYWRLMGRVDPFPIGLIWFGDAILIIGMLCIIRISAPQKPRNWPWVGALIGGIIFGLASTFMD